MNKQLLLILVYLAIGSPAVADVYRWVDKEGKVHFTDKKPAEDSENVTDQVNKQNIDTSSEELRKVETIMRKENDADREYAQQLQFEEARIRQHRCTRAKKRMQEISGRVIFIDEEGKVVKTTEQQRQQKIAEVNALIQENCD